MLKRIAAFLFVLTVAGNVWAGVCDCFGDGDHPASKCCKRERTEENSVSQKPCCEEDCGQPGYVTVHRTQTESNVRIHAPGDVPVVEFSVPAFGLYRPNPSLGVRSASTFQRKYLPRPPDLYLKHHSFLI